MVVKLIDDKGLWDKFIEESPYGTIFHLWDFLKIIEKHSGCKLYPYGVYRGGELTCLFPVYVRNFMGSIMVFSPPPGMAIPYLGFVMSRTYDALKQRRKETYLNEMADEMEAEIKKLSANFVYISTVNRFVDVRPFKWNQYDVRMYYSYAIDLKRPLDEIRDNFDDSLKRDIQESEKQPYSICPAGDIDAFYGMVQDRYRREGRAFIVGKEYLKDVLTAFPDNVKTDLLCEGDKAIIPIVYYQYKKRFTFWMWPDGGGSDLHRRGYIAWHYIRNKKAEGLQSLEIPGASEKRLCAFISKFNAPLIYNFNIARNDLKGRIGKRMYSSVVKARI
jgi:hypothetical protein